MAHRDSTLRIPFPTQLVVFVVALTVFAYRGWDARDWLMYLDEVFVQHAVDPAVVYGGIRGAIDPLGLTNSFSGYIHFVPRVLAEIYTSLSLGAYPFATWITASLTWSMTAWVIFVAIATAARSQVAGLVAAAAFVLHPASNVILLGQLNALQWPMLLACTVIAITMYRPTTRVAQVGIFLLFILTALSAALSFLIIALLLIASITPTSRRYALSLTVATSIPFLFQLLTYFGQDTRIVESHAWADLVREASYALQIVVPGGLREGVASSPDSLATALIIISWLVLAGTLTVAVIRARTVGVDITRMILMFMGAGSVFLVVSVYFNGNLNHQYLVVPYGCLWSAVAISCSLLLRQSDTRHIGQWAALVAIGIFSFSATPLLNKSLKDPFFVQPFVGDWASVVDDARAECLVQGGEFVHPEGTSDTFSLPCVALD